MKKIFLALLAISILGIWSVGLSQAAFTDVPDDHPHVEGISYGQGYGIFAGYEDGTFKPDSPVNRAEFTKIIVNAIYLNEATGSNCFPDVKDEWFAEFVCYAKERNILGGYPDGTFQPGNNIAFSEGAKIIVNTFGMEVDTEDPVWFRPFVKELGVRRAIPTTITDFGQLMTRGEMAEIVYRLLEKITDKPSQTYEGLESGELYTPYLWYENLAFKIKYPEAWQVTEAETAGLPIISFTSPASEEDDFQESVSVIGQDLSAQPMTLQEYTDLTESQLEQIISEYKKISLDSASLGNESAQKIVYTSSVEGQTYKFMQVWTIKDQIAIVLTYSALESTYDDFMKDAEAIIDSFEFL